ASDLRVLYMLGLIEENQQLFQEAERRFAKVLESDPDDPCALLHRGICQQEGGAVEEAEKTFKKLISRWPRVGVAHYRLGRILMNAGRAGEAQDQFKLLEKGTGNQAPYVSLPVGPIGRKPKPIDRYLQAAADSKSTGEWTEPEAEYTNTSQERGIAFQHAGTS